MVRFLRDGQYSVCDWLQLVVKCYSRLIVLLLTLDDGASGYIIYNRSQIQMDKSLKIEKVRVTDEGVYICRAENAIGFIEAHVKLIVSGKQDCSLSEWLF